MKKPKREKINEGLKKFEGRRITEFTLEGIRLDDGTLISTTKAEAEYHARV